MLVGLLVVLGILMGFVFIGSFETGGFSGGILLILVVIILFAVILSGAPQ